MKNQTILVIDDDDIVREATARVLNCCCYPNVLQAASGQKGIQMIREHNPDLVVTGQTLPGMSGDEVVRWISQEHKPTHPSIKVIALNGDDRHVAKPVAKAAGYDAFLPRLSNMAKVRSTVDSLLG